MIMYSLRMVLLENVIKECGNMESLKYLENIVYFWEKFISKYISESEIIIYTKDKMFLLCFVYML